MDNAGIIFGIIDVLRHNAVPHEHYRIEVGLEVDNSSIVSALWWYCGITGRHCYFLNTCTSLVDLLSMKSVLKLFRGMFWSFPHGMCNAGGSERCITGFSAVRPQATLVDLRSSTLVQCRSAL